MLLKTPLAFFFCCSGLFASFAGCGKIMAYKNAKMFSRIPYINTLHVPLFYGVRHGNVFDAVIPGGMELYHARN